MQALVRQVAGRLYRNESVVYAWRRERMRAMRSLLELPSRARVIDLGGDEFLWSLFDHDFHVTFVNLPGWVKRLPDPARYSMVEGDACDLKGVFPDRCFDLCFSNSTIEHVGGAEAQSRFAAEVRRLAPAYWVQTPSSRCPLEVHTGVPFYWSLPPWVRERLLRHWEQGLPGFTAMVRNTTVLTDNRLKELFPDGKIFRERRFGFEKSYSVYRRVHAPATSA
jgi:hypothetical protein